MKDKYLDLLTGIILGVTAGVFFPVGEYKALLAIMTLIVTVRLVVAK